jgi:ribonuclease VapC
MASIILDASALLAYVKSEVGAEVAAGVIGDAAISAVNFSEAVSKLVGWGASLDAARAALSVATIDVIDFDRELAEQVGALAARTKRFGVSLGDRACLALAARDGLPVLTGDRAWSKLGLDIDIRFIR